LCKVIAKFRPGLTDIALSGQLGQQVINLVAHINAWVQDINNYLRDSNVYSLHELSQCSRNVTLCGEFLRRGGLSLTEQLLVITLLLFCYSTDTTRGLFILTAADLQSRCKFIRSRYIDVRERNESFMTWVGTVLVATFSPGTQPSLLGMELLKARPIARNWQENVRICEDYLWNDALSLKLSSRIGHLAGEQRQGQG
jgi:hypothetical protein